MKQIQTLMKKPITLKICSKEYKTKKEAEAKLQEFINQLENDDGFLKELEVGTDD